ncbi:magnesium transporter CorA family protein [Candidatus Parcubacteria bacterium]|jgi:magnesium transporter|nr:magnesium transporter CorA family protein [Candidatus Parcubacteria bacterium]
MLKVYFKTAQSKRLKKVQKIREGSWININHAEHNDLEDITKLTDLSLLDLQDTLDLQELPRMERHNKSIILFIRTPIIKNSDHKFIHTVPLAIIINSKYFITISAEKNSIIKEIQKNSLSIATTQRGKMLVYVLLKVSRSFTNRVKEISYEVLSKKKHIENIKNSDISELINHEDVLNQYISALIPMRNLFENLMSSSYLKFYREDQDLFDDMLNSIRQSVDICQVNLKSIKSLRESYQILFTNRLNKIIQFLTAFTIVMTIPTIIASLYGMNVELPLAGSKFAFLYVLFFSSFGIAAFLFLFYKKKWL